MVLTRTLNYTHAASELHLTRQALAKSIHRLEEELGEPLFTSNRSVLQLTAEGERIRRAAALLLSAYDTFTQDVFGEKKTYSLFVALATGTRISLPPHAFSTFHLENPDISLILEDMNTDAAVAAVRRGEAEIALVGSIPAYLTEFDSMLVRHTGLRLAVPIDNALYNRDYLTITDLQGQPLVTAGPRNHVHRFLSEQCQKAGIKPDYAFMTSDASLLTAYAQEKHCLYFAFPPDILPTPEGFRILPLITDPPVAMHTYAIKKAGSTLSTAGQILWNYFKTLELLPTAE